MGNLTCNLPDRSNLRLSERFTNHTVFINAFQYCDYNSMYASKSQMFFADGRNFLTLAGIWQNSIDKSRALWFNVFNSYSKNVDGKLVLIRMFQRAAGWCEAVHSVWAIWFLSWPCKRRLASNEARMPRYRLGFC